MLPGCSLSPFSQQMMEACLVYRAYTVKESLGGQCPFHLGQGKSENARETCSGHEKIPLSYCPLRENISLLIITDVFKFFIVYIWSLPSSRGLTVKYLTQTNMVLGSRPTSDHWWRQEGHPALNARARAKVLSEAAPKPQGTGGNGGKID